MRVGFIGCGRLGMPVAVAMAHLSHTVWIHDPAYVEQDGFPVKWPHKEAGYFDRPFEQLYYDSAGSMLNLADSIEELANESDIIFVAVQTPHAPQYEGVTPREESDTADFDYSYLEAALRELARVVKEPKAVCIISTVAPGTYANRLKEILAANPLLRYVYNPFFIAMGTVVRDFLNPEFVLIGCDDRSDGLVEQVMSFYRTLHDKPVRVMSIASAELVKMKYNCYAEDTDVLTSQGWKRFSALTGDEQILSLNPEKMEVEWVGIRKVVHRPHDGEMVHFHSQKDDVLVTPEHFMFVGTLTSLPSEGKNYSYHWRLKQAHEVEKMNAFSFCRKAGWAGDDPGVFALPDGTGVPADIMADFLGWYLAEGCVSATQIQISQSRRANPEKWGKVAKICGRLIRALGLGDAGHYGPLGVTFYHAGLAAFLRPMGKSLSKRIPHEIKGWSASLLRRILDGLCDGDGSKQKTVRWRSGTKPLRDRRYFSTSSPQLSADIAELIVKTGHHPSHRVQQSKLSPRDNHLIYELLGETSSHQKGRSAGLKVSRRQYSGEVWCAVLDRNHVMLTRRNGKCAWAGNTYITAKIVLANDLLEWCEAFGGDADDVSEALKAATDRIVSTKYMTPGMGDGGGCHPRDNIVMSELAQQRGFFYDIAGQMMLAREEQAANMAFHAYSSAMAFAIRSDAGKLPPVVVAGLAFKPETNIRTGSAAMLCLNVLRARWPSVQAREWEPADGPCPVDGPAVFLIGCKHEFFATYDFPAGSVVIDPFRYIPDRVGVTVKRVGEGPK